MSTFSDTRSDSQFPTLCREWRSRRHLSQLALAERALVSQRHVSWLETGRSEPSREMVLKLAEALEIPLRDRNVLLHAAGFAPRYQQSAIDDVHMESVRSALTRVLEHHEPYPAMAVDREWNLVLSNKAACLMLSLAGITPTEGTPINLAEATLRPDALRRYIQNPEEAIPSFIQRLRSEAVASGDRALIARIEGLIRMAGDVPPASISSTALLPVLPLELSMNGVALSLFSVISTFGTPQDITTDELRLEAFYPNDSATRAFFESAT